VRSSLGRKSRGNDACLRVDERAGSQSRQRALLCLLQWVERRKVYSAGHAVRRCPDACGVDIALGRSWPSSHDNIAGGAGLCPFHFREPGRLPFRSSDKFWIAASDAAVEGEWRWVAGPEAGQQFWRGSVDLRGHVTGQSFGYQNWPKSSSESYFFEPNNQPMNRRLNPEGEDYLAMSLSRYETSWPSWNDVIGLDDYDDFSPRLAIVEFSVPEPSSGALIAGAGLMLVAACRRRGKSEVPR
jgi:hypothetical protein